MSIKNLNFFIDFKYLDIDSCDLISEHLGNLMSDKEGESVQFHEIKFSETCLIFRIRSSDP